MYLGSLSLIEVHLRPDKLTTLYMFCELHNFSLGTITCLKEFFILFKALFNIAFGIRRRDTEHEAAFVRLKHVYDVPFLAIGQSDSTAVRDLTTAQTVERAWINRHGDERLFAF